jgi:hypothetical protein
VGRLRSPGRSLGTALALMQTSMDDRPAYAAPAAPWHALLAPIPVDAAPSRKPVASPEVLATPHAGAIAGWEQLTVELSAGPAGLRHVMVLLDAAGQPIAASDTVLYRSTAPRTGDAADHASAIRTRIEFCQESIGGRIEHDGTFRGTRWRTVSVDPEEGSEPTLESTPSQPSAADVAGIRALVADLLRRAAPPRHGSACTPGSSPT